MKKLVAIFEVNKNLWGYDYIDGKLVVNEREADMVRRLYKFASRLEIYKLPLNDAALERMNNYWERLKKRAGVENVSKPSPYFWQQKNRKPELKRSLNSELLEYGSIIDSDLFEKVNRKIKKDKS